MTEIPLSSEQLAVIRTTMHAQRISQAQVGQWLGLGQARVSERLLGKKPFCREQILLLCDRLGLTEVLLLAPDTPDVRARQHRLREHILHCLAQTLVGFSGPQLTDFVVCLAWVLRGHGAVADAQGRHLRQMLDAAAADPEAWQSPAVAPRLRGAPSLEEYLLESAPPLATTA